MGSAYDRRVPSVARRLPPAARRAQIVDAALGVFARRPEAEVSLEELAEAEAKGIDLDQHAEVAYDLEGAVQTPGTAPTPQAVVASAERLVARSAAEGQPTS